MPRYKLTFKPLGAFFFGAEQTFGAFGDKERGSYLAVSAHFPNQTTLLGMLKKQILIQEGLITQKIRGAWVDKKDKARARELVGSEKFNFSCKEQDFGVIKRLSPIHLVDKSGKLWFRSAFVDDLELKKESNYYYLKSFSYKNGDPWSYLLTPDRKEHKEIDNIFKSVETVGILKKNQENSFFKKRAWRLDEDFEFAIDVEVDIELKSDIVSLGADGSRFLMRIHKELEPLEDQAVVPKGWDIILLSDSFIQKPLKELCGFGVTSMKSHRMLAYKKGVLRGKTTEFKKSREKQLIEQGSLLKEPKEELFKKLNCSNIQKIGLNIYKEQQ